MTFLEDLGRGIDALVGVVSPRAELRRSSARVMRSRVSRIGASASKAYDAARDSRRWLNRATSSGSADVDLDEWTLKALRERSRDRFRNDGVARAALKSMTDNVIGVGFRPQLRLPYEHLGISKQQADDLAGVASLLWEVWGEHADVTNRLHIDDLQSLAFCSTLKDGDVLVTPHMVTYRTRPGPLELKLEVLEADRLDTPLHLKNRDIRQGVELGRNGQPIAYWVTEQHPGDVYLHRLPQQKREGTRKFRRIPAYSAVGRPNVLHLFDQERIGGSRGVPLLAVVLDLFKDLDEYVEAELVAAQVAACFTVFITKTDPWTAALARATTDTAGKKERDEELSPGLMSYLGPGESIESANPGRPNTVFEAFVQAVMRRITSAIGMPLEVALRDFSNTTYSQARAALLEARRMFACRQRWMVRHLLQPVWRMVLEEAYLKQLLPLPVGLRDFRRNLELWTRTHWITPGFGLIDPDKEAKAMRTQLELGVTTRAKIVASIDGDDAGSVTEQLAAEEEQRRRLGLTSSSTGASSDSGGGSGDDDEGDDEGGDGGTDNADDQVDDGDQDRGTDEEDGDADRDEAARHDREVVLT